MPGDMSQVDGRVGRWALGFDKLMEDPGGLGCFKVFESKIKFILVKVHINRIFFICLITSSCCSHIKIERKTFFVKFSFQHLRGINASNFTSIGIYNTAQDLRLGIA